MESCLKFVKNPQRLRRTCAGSVGGGGQTDAAAASRTVSSGRPMQARSLLLSAYVTRRDFSRQVVFGLGLASLGSRLEAFEPAPRQHRFLCCDYQGNKVSIVAADGSVEWEYAAETPQDCWLMPGGNILFCYRAGVKEVSREK